MAIKLLDNYTISKIAAGEVIENPASVVKELVENAIDASAHHIVVEMTSGGTEYIKVSDDGIGFDKEDIKIAFLQHSTSKLSNINELESISSYGFRGEALSSIASVCKVCLTTKKIDSNEAFGYRYEIDFGKKSEIEAVPANVGSVIEVYDLFKNIPVRKKFLKSITRENAYVEDLITKIALARPDISFELYLDGKCKFISDGNNKIEDIIYSIYGSSVVDNLIEIDDKINDIRVKGFITKPIVSRNSKEDEIYFVNGRYIKSKIISSAIEKAYDGYLMQHKYPLVVLKIEIAGNRLDVNVHPKKLEVRFSNDELVYDSVYSIVHDALENIELIHEEQLPTYDNHYSEEKVFDKTSDLLVENDEKKEKFISDLPSLSSIIDYKLNAGLDIKNLHDNIKQRFEEKPFIQKTLSEDHKYIGQVFNTYILVEFEEKLYIIDQHAAHEKINFERIMNAYRNKEVMSQKVFPSIVLKLTPIQYDAVVSNMDEFAKVGYEIELFGDNDIRVDAVPYPIFSIGNEKLLTEIIDSFIDVSNKEKYDSLVEKIASISCKKAIKANYIMSENEVKQLLRDLSSLENPYNCPHGRPTIISLSKTEFEKRFGRIVI